MIFTLSFLSSVANRCQVSDDLVGISSIEIC
jgi:hypothetical protein